METRELIIHNELGLHARPAARIAKIAAKARHGIWLEKNGNRVDATSTLDILALVCEQGSTIRLHAESAADLDVLEQLTRLIDNHFEE